MKSWLKIVLFACLCSSPLLAQTLGEATEQVRDGSQTLISQAAPLADTWGEKTALDDLRSLHEASVALVTALGGTDADAVRVNQQNLTVAARRVNTSQSLLPQAGDESAAIADLLSRVGEIDVRLTQLRQRFDEKATHTLTPMADVSLAVNSDAFTSYQNPQELLIDVRDARRLAQSLPVGRFPQYGFGFEQPNNLDSLQVRRFVLAGWALENALLGNYSDISEIQPAWKKFDQEYNRLGYPGNNTITRQLDRVMVRLGSFFADVSQ